MKTHSDKSFLVMPKLSIPISPLSGMVLCFVCFATYYVFFQPTIYGLLLLAVVDVFMNMLFTKINVPLTFKYFPYSKYYFDGFHIEKLNSLDHQGKVNALKEMFSFPRHRALHVIFITYVKSIAGGSIILFVWDYHDRTFLVQLGSFLFILTLFCSFFASCCYLETHQYLSNKLKKLSQSNPSWELVFDQVTMTDQKKELALAFFTTLSSLIFLYGGLAIHLSAMSNFSKPYLTLMLGTTFTCMFLLISHISILYLRHISGGLDSVFSAMDRLDLNQKHKIPLSSSEFVGKFQIKYNKLINRLNKQEREINHWMEESSEKYRYQGIGEIAQYILEELRNSVHVYTFLSQQLILPENQVEPKIKSHLDNTNDKLFKLIAALEGQVKCNPNSTANVSLKESIDSAYEHSRFKYNYDGADQIEFIVDPRCRDINLSVPRIDLVQIFIELINSSIENLILSKTTAPYISIQVEPRANKSNKKIAIIFSNNGSPLSKEDFTTLTLDPLHKNISGYRLALVFSKSIFHGGSFQKIDTDNGTTFEITLPQAVRELKVEKDGNLLKTDFKKAQLVSHDKITF